MTLHWCVRVGQENARDRPAPLEKTQEQTDPNHWPFGKLARSTLNSPEGSPMHWEHFDHGADIGVRGHGA
ncbi:MAG: hypothetical protein RKO24_02485, partial [Candidatus Competibacter sp.]|nr:hypothetical protein [Candidatus Competibacter sp.]